VTKNMNLAQRKRMFRAYLYSEAAHEIGCIEIGADDCKRFGLTYADVIEVVDEVVLKFDGLANDSTRVKDPRLWDL